MGGKPVRPLAVVAFMCPLLSAQAWDISFSALVAARSADLYSSRGLYESNPLLRSPDGRFSMARGVAVAVPSLVFVQVVQKWAIRKWPQARKPFTIVNFAVAGATVGVVAHNERLR